MLHFITVATHSERYLPVLEKMVEDNGNKLNKLAFGEKYKGHFMKDLETIKFLKKIPSEDIVIFVDGFDTIMFSKTDEIIDKFKSFNKKLVLSIENIKNSFLTHSYNFMTVRNKYINTGLYIGYAGFILNMLEDMYSLEYDKKSNQANWSIYLNNDYTKINLNDIELDVDSKLFLNHSEVCNNKFTIINKRILLDTKIKPCLLQGNGAVNLNSVIDKLEYDKYNIYKKDLTGFNSLSNKIKYLKIYPVLKYYILSIALLIIFIILIIYVLNKKILITRFRV